MFTIMVIMALVTTVMASPLLEWIYPRSKMTVDPALAGARQRPAALLCISDQSIARAMVVLGASLVKRGQDLAALHVLPADRPSVYMRATGEGGRERLLDRVQALGKSLEVEIRPIPAVSDDPGSTILEIAAAEGPELVLLGAHRPVLGRSPFGGVVQEIQRKANFPTGLLVDNGLAQLGRVLVVAARSRSGELAADLARRMAEADSLELTRIDLGPDYSVLRSSDQPPRRIDGDAVGKAAFSRLREFGPVSVLAKYDLVIVPMDLGGPAEAGRPSAVLEAMVRECPTSVLVIQSA
jgi:nucleotide-binding universal stress UspA family protein